MKRFITSFLLCCWVILSFAQEKVTYRLAPKIGQPMVYTMTTVAEMNLLGLPITYTYKAKLKNTPISKQNGLTTFSSQIEDLSITTTDAGVNKVLEQALVSTKATITTMRTIIRLDEQGNVVEGPLFEGLSTEKAKDLMEQINPDLAMSNDMKTFPKHAIAVGDTWTVEKETSNGQIKLKYKLEKLDAHAMTVSFAGTIPMKFDFQVKGENQFERTTGMLIPGTMKVKMTGNTGKENGKITINTTM